MDVKYLSDSGARHDWMYAHDGKTYVISFHYENDCWTVQLLRDDSERQILSEEEAARVLDAFPKQRALNMSVRTEWTEAEDRVCADPLVSRESGDPRRDYSEVQK